MGTREMTVQEVLDWLDSVAPFDTQEDFDNSGLQLGHAKQSVRGILLALDATEQVVEEALALGANLIVAHHPLIFTPQKDMNLARHTPRLLSLLIRHQIALVAAHTNLDKSQDYSASLAVCGLLGLVNIRRAGDYLFLGDVPGGMDAGTLRQKVSESLGVPARLYGSADRAVCTLAVAGGAYSEGFEEAMAAGAQALLTGEVRHHHAVEAAEMGMLLLEGGHFGTEAPMLAPLALGLQNMADTLQYSVRVHVSRQEPYRLQ